jgi:zinc transport system substrate-binding protein
LVYHAVTLTRLFTVPVIALSLAVAGCHRAPRPRPKVVTSIFPIFDLARRVAGPDADVVMLEPVEVSEHQYSPSRSDMDRALGASLAVMIGLDLDAWMQPMMTRVAPSSRVLRLADRVPTLPRQPSLTDVQQARRAEPDDDPRMPNAIDAHVWLDPQRAVLMTRAIGEELCRVDPAHARGYRARSQAVTESIDALDRAVEERAATWGQRAFVTLHDDFRYYAARYHLDVAAVVEPTPGIRPSIRYDQVVIRRLRERGAAGVFGEPQLDSQPARTLAEASGLPYGVLDPLGGTAGVDSYEALIRFDTDALEKVLAPRPTGTR